MVKSGIKKQSDAARLKFALHAPNINKKPPKMQLPEQKHWNQF